MCKSTWSSRRPNHKYFSQLFWQHFDTLHSLNCLGTEVKTRSDKSFCFKKVKACRILNSWMNNLKWIYWNWKSFRQCVKSVQIRSFFWSVFSCIRTRKNSVFGHILCSKRANKLQGVQKCLTYCTEQTFWKQTKCFT